MRFSFKILRTCMEDGTLLSPDIPATSLDTQLLKLALDDKVVGPTGGGVWATFTSIGHAGGIGLQYDHVLVPLLGKPYVLTAEELWRHNAGRHGSNGPRRATTSPYHAVGAAARRGGRFVVVENGANGAQLHNGVVLFGADEPIMLEQTTRAGFRLYHTTPLLGNGWGYVGELEKFVPVSNARVKSISSTEKSIKVFLAGAPAEEVMLSFVNGNAQRDAATGTLPLVTVKCVFGQAGMLRASPEGCSSESYIH